MVIVGNRAMPKYAIEIFYSDEDEGHIAAVPELLNYCSLLFQYLHAYGNKSKKNILPHSNNIKVDVRPLK